MSSLPLRSRLEAWVDQQIEAEPDPATRAVLTFNRARIVDQIELITLRHTAIERDEPQSASVVKLNSSAPAGKRVFQVGSR